MKEISAKQLAQALSKKGFIKESGKRHDQYFFVYNSKRTSIRVSISRGSGYAYSGDLLRRLRADEMKLDKQNFIDFIQCPLTVEMYAQYLIQKGVIRVDPAPD